MVTIPLYIFFFIFLGALLIIGIFYFISISHLFATANLTFASFVITFIVFALATFALYGTWFYLRGTDWQQSVKIFDKNWFGGNNPYIQ